MITRIHPEELHSKSMWEKEIQSKNTAYIPRLNTDRTENTVEGCHSLGHTWKTVIRLWVRSEFSFQENRTEHVLANSCKRTKSQWKETLVGNSHSRKRKINTCIIPLEEFSLPVWTCALSTGWALVPHPVTQHQEEAYLPGALTNLGFKDKKIPESQDPRNRWIQRTSDTTRITGGGSFSQR